MTIKYAVLVFLCFSTVLWSQSMNVTKSDGSVVSFKIADIDSIAISAASLAKTITANNFMCISNNALSPIHTSEGVFEDTDDGLKIFTSKIDDGLQLVPTQAAALMEKTLYLRWKVSGGAATVSVNALENTQNLSPVCNVFSLSTQSSTIAEDTWYFTRITVSGSVAKSVTAMENFDNNGGTIVHTSSVPFYKAVSTYSFSIKANQPASAVLADAHIE